MPICAPPLTLDRWRLSAMAPGSLFVDHTVSAAIARELTSETGETWSCSSSMRQSRANGRRRNGALGIIVRGTGAAFAAARPVMATYTGRASAIWARQTAAN
jgi:3-hydroxyisobutyrate dehydrogenase